uniref:Uncharacterized protein n=1 Tax=Vespula pensylvanica TaxID=30213 RepID=A0A834PGI8_VESPE|nr:hypothetical protein H0235_001586 [Vespula pensylvanica]
MREKLLDERMGVFHVKDESAKRVSRGRKRSARLILEDHLHSHVTAIQCVQVRHCQPESILSPCINHASERVLSTVCKIYANHRLERQLARGAYLQSMEGIGHNEAHGNLPITFGGDSKSC